ncbi:MAG TPA: PfkB family carbohydrate kinase [Solirubrobacteraceae bacterium]
MTQLGHNPSEDLILVGGEALYDLVLDDAGELRAHPGGGPFNTARTVGRLQQPVVYLGRLSTDRFGTALHRILADDGVGLDTVVRTDEPTTLALAEIDADGAATYRFYAQGTSAPGLTPEAALGALPADVGIVHVGTLGMTLEPMACALEAVVDELAGRALVALDPNSRPAIITDRDGYLARLRRLLGRSHVVKVSEEDLAWLDPERPPIAAARALLEHGTTLALVTRGARGAAVVTPDEEVPVPAPAVDVVDTIGAGDAFGGGFLAWWRSHALGPDDLRRLEVVVEATRFACLVAARTCERPGASPPYLSELESVGPPAP